MQSNSIIFVNPYILQQIDKKFSEFRLGIEAGSARFKQCEQMAARLMDDRSPYSATILEKQEQLR